MLAALVGSGVAWSYEWPLLAAGVFFCASGWVAWQVFRSHRFWRCMFSVTFLAIGVPALVAGLQQLRCRYQAQPPPTRVREFEGVEYIREVVKGPRSAVVHILRVDLSAEAVDVLVTPPDYPGDEHPLQARTTSQFLTEFKLQAAINASNFFPFERRNPLTYLSFTAGRKDILGGAASHGVEYGERSRYYPILHVSADRHASILHEWPEAPYTAAAGIKHFIVDGKPIDKPIADDWTLHTSDNEDAVTAVGVDQTGRILFLVVVDGDQPPYSVRIERRRLADLLLSQGVYNALSLDGGGSSTMVIEGPDGAAECLNRPVQLTIPGIERPVGNHIGIRARHLPD